MMSKRLLSASQTAATGGATIEFLGQYDYDNSPSEITSGQHTFSNVSFGTEETNRFIIIVTNGYGGDGDSANVVIPGVTVYDFTLVSSSPNGTGPVTSIVHYGQPTGTSDSIRVTHNRASRGDYPTTLSISVYKVVSSETYLLPTVVADYEATAGVSLSLSVPDGSVYLSNILGENSATPVSSATGTQDYNVDITGGNEYVVGYSGSGSTTATLTSSTGSARVASLVAFEPSTSAIPLTSVLEDDLTFVPINVQTTGSADSTANYDIVDFAFTASESTHRVYLGCSSQGTSTYYQQDLCIGAIQVLSGTGFTTIEAAFDPSNTSNTGVVTTITTGFTGNPTAGTHVAGGLNTTVNTGRWNIGSSTGSTYTGAADGIGSSYAGSSPTILPVPANDAISQVSSTNFFFFEASNSNFNANYDCGWFYLDLSGLTSGTVYRVRTAYLYAGLGDGSDTFKVYVT